jgi:hypothetical protein
LISGALVKKNDYNEDKRLEIKARREVKSRQVGSAWDKESFQKVLNDFFLFWKLSTKT